MNRTGLAMDLPALARPRTLASMTTPDQLKRILVIDDEYAIRMLLKTFLEGHGYQVAVADCGDRAIRVMEGFRPDLVISDIVLPAENGLSIVSRIREQNPSIKVIYLSAWVDESETERRLIEELAAHPEYRLLKKPFDLDNLLRAVEAAAG